LKKKNITKTYIGRGDKKALGSPSQQKEKKGEKEGNS